MLGQPELQYALLLNVVNPNVKGVYACGERGTGKTTVVRSLKGILPQVELIEGDAFNGSPYSLKETIQKPGSTTEKSNVDRIRESLVPLVDLPLGATEDRLCGTIDMQQALKDGSKSFEPGLLAIANGGLLYIDEANLLEDHLVDVILDSAASGWNTVEREGVSYAHRSDFILIGSGNPEEGELRPQLADRFGLYVDMYSPEDFSIRSIIAERNADFKRDPDALRERFSLANSFLKARIANAQSLLPEIKKSGLSSDMRDKIGKLCSELGTDGVRGDLILTEAAYASAALCGRDKVIDFDIYNVAVACLWHRLPKNQVTQIESPALKRAEKKLKISNVVLKFFPDAISQAKDIFTTCPMFLSDEEFEKLSDLHKKLHKTNHTDTNSLLMKVPHEDQSTQLVQVRKFYMAYSYIFIEAFELEDFRSEDLRGLV
jgi:magnesium chelatase subunit I